MDKKRFIVEGLSRKCLSDSVTPVSIYLRLRDTSSRTFLLESTDFCGSENSFSYICFTPVASFSVANSKVSQVFPDGERKIIDVSDNTNVMTLLDDFRKSFIVSDVSNDSMPTVGGLFGYMSYGAVTYCEDIQLHATDAQITGVPDMHFDVFAHVIAIDHFRDEMHIFDYRYVQEDAKAQTTSTASHTSLEQKELRLRNLERLEKLVNDKDYPDYSFKMSGNESSNFSDKEFLKIIEQGKAHNHRGDVFQVVLSRRFWQKFSGDEFQVYRALRSINPSPYLFYFDYGGYKIFGSSPEAQIVKTGSCVSINPIAGTFRRTGNEIEDLALAESLKVDEKENAEHVMLVDLARNDLSKHCYKVEVEKYKDILFFSHVIHLVSTVTGWVSDEVPSLSILSDTFPAGTLSGAPKYRAMELIDSYENTARSFYGGCIGFIGFNGDYNQAIIIRSFLSKDNTLYYQAGAGVVSDSQPESELNEVSNKLLALRSAMESAEGLCRSNE